MIAPIVNQVCASIKFGSALSTGAAFVAERWPGQQISLIADSRESLIALLSLDGERVSHGFWSDSVYLACMHHNGLASELRLAAMAPRSADPLVHFSLLTAKPPGLIELIERPRTDSRL